MAKGKSKSLSFFFVICLVLTALITTFIVINRGTGGFMSRAASNCSANTNKSDCKYRSSCDWTNKGSASTKSRCVTKLLKGSQCKSTGIPCALGLTCKNGTCQVYSAGRMEQSVDTAAKCSRIGDKCCTNPANAIGYCEGAMTCNPTTYKCAAYKSGMGQERGLKGTCSLQFRGASCNWTSTCKSTGGINVLGYCQGPINWQCCKPK